MPQWIGWLTGVFALELDWLTKEYSLDGGRLGVEAGTHSAQLVTRVSSLYNVLLQADAHEVAGTSTWVSPNSIVCLLEVWASPSQHGLRGPFLVGSMDMPTVCISSSETPRQDRLVFNRG